MKPAGLDGQLPRALRELHPVAASSFGHHAIHAQLARAQSLANAGAAPRIITTGFEPWAASNGQLGARHTS